MRSGSKAGKSRPQSREHRADETPLRIGVTGHRRNRLHLSDEEFNDRIAYVIRALSKAGRGRKRSLVEVISALAEGADEMAAEVALQENCRLTALLPFKPNDYETTFSARAYCKTFRTLFRKADEQVVLPGTLRRPQDAYVAVGRATVARSDVILTIWDGLPAQGRGGTPEILQAALDEHIPIVWVHASRKQAPRIIERAAKGPAPRLESAAKKSRPFSALPLRRRTHG